MLRFLLSTCRKPTATLTNSVCFRHPVYGVSRLLDPDNVSALSGSISRIHFTLITSKTNKSKSLSFHCDFLGLQEISKLPNRRSYSNHFTYFSITLWSTELSESKWRALDMTLNSVTCLITAFLHTNRLWWGSIHRLYFPFAVFIGVHSVRSVASKAHLFCSWIREYEGTLRHEWRWRVLADWNVCKRMLCAFGTTRFDQWLVRVTCFQVILSYKVFFCKFASFISY